MGEGLIMMTFDMVWLILLGFYLEQVLPKTYGLRRSPIFCISPWYWGCCGNKNKKNKKVKKGTTASETGIEMSFPANKIDHMDSARAG